MYSKAIKFDRVDNAQRMELVHPHREASYSMLGYKMAAHLRTKFPGERCITTLKLATGSPVLHSKLPFGHRSTKEYYVS